MENNIHVLLFSGLFTSISCEYVLIEEHKAWDDARVYCRQNHIDLACVPYIQGCENILTEVGPALTSLAWIGLYNDIDSWRWSYQDEPVTFWGWQLDQPDNKKGKQECVTLENDGWSDGDCTDLLLPVFCFNDMKTGEDRFVFLSDISMSWPDAQSYCRQHYTDLATVRSQAENDLLLTMTQGYFRAWIGLFRDSWKLTDGRKLYKSSINWGPSTGDITGQNRPCGGVDPYGWIDDEDCSTALPFICKQSSDPAESNKQIVRFEMKSGLDVKDPAVMETILQSIKLKLKDHGIEKDTTVTWRLQPDGHVFTPEPDSEEKN